MKTFKIFSTAALALMLAACSSEDTALNNSPAQQQGRKVHFTATIAAPGGNAGTRTEYTEVTEGDAAGTINVAWKAGDEIALIHNGTKDLVKVETVNENGSATITGDITVGTNGEAVTAYYPAAAIELNSDKKPVSAAAYTEKMLAQDGTLSYIASNLDLRSGESTIAVDGDKATLASSVSLTSNTAIWKLTLLDSNEAELKATQVTIKSGSDELASTAVLTTGKSTLYLAVPADGTSANICITATTADNDYFYMKEGVALEAKKYYQSTVQMTKGAHLAFLSADYEAKDGAILTGTLDGAHKISIADGATVTLDNATIEGINSDWYQYAGITCLGDATIILKEGTTNTVNGFDSHFPGIQGAAGKTLTITGSGTLNAKSYGTGAGIGSGYGSERACGNIIIEGGTITATGGSSAAGIGSGSCGNCGNISISGGTVTATGGAYGAGIGSGCEGNCGNILISGGTVSATGGQWAAGIGSGDEGSCGNITITTSVTKVTATRDGGFETVGSGGNGRCGTVTIGCTLNSDGNPVGGTTGTITQSPYEYPLPAATAHTLAASVVGDVVDTDGNAYTLDATHVLPSGVTAVAMVAYKSGSNGLAIQLNASPESMDWKAACSYTSYPSITGNPGTWRLPSKADWQNMFVGCAKSGDAGAGDTMNPIAGFKEKIGATGITWKSDNYWSSTDSGMNAWYVLVNLNGSVARANFGEIDMSTPFYVLGCLAF